MNCKNCKAGCYWAGQDVTEPDHGNCYVGYVPKTNADRIRSMTDEELAEELLDLFAIFFLVEWSNEVMLDYLRQDASKGRRIAVFNGTEKDGSM